MNSTNRVYIATSKDGFIADENNGLEWLDSIPEINTIDTGYESFMSTIDALVMGRNTYETVLSFDIEWPYNKPVFVATNSLKSVPKELTGKVFLTSGNPQEIVNNVHNEGYYSLYIDGGRLIQSFTDENLIDELIITIIPVNLEKGVPLFENKTIPSQFELIESKTFIKNIVQNHYTRKD